LGAVQRGAAVQAADDTALRTAQDPAVQAADATCAQAQRAACGGPHGALRRADVDLPRFMSGGANAERHFASISKQPIARAAIGDDDKNESISGPHCRKRRML